MGGVERYTYNLAKGLVQKGNEVTIITSNILGLPTHEKTEGIEVYRLPAFDCLNGRYPLLKLNGEFWKIHRIIKTKQFDMVIVNTRFYLHSLYGMMIAKKQNVHCITIEHGTSHLSVHSKLLDFVGSIYEHMLTKIDCLFCKNYYGVSEACNEWLKHFHIKAKGVLYNSIDVFSIETMRAHLIPTYRQQYQIPSNAVVITFTGRLLKEKGLPSLLNVMDRICREREDVYLFIAGDGDMQNEVDERKTPHIIPLGRIDFEHIVALLSESDIFCLPSFSEGFSTSILEAAACGCYILTTARGGAKELLITDEYGSVIPNNEEEVLYSALLDVLENPTKREMAVKLTYERLKSVFTWTNVVEKVENICEKTKEYL